jgi:poly(A) polymerase
MGSKVAGQMDRFSEFLQQIAGLATGNPSIYLVGGAVRDHLINRPIYDWDFVMQGDIRPFSKKIANVFRGAYYLMDEERNISRVIINFQGEKMVLDFAASRADSLKEDLEKRDFTVNAMALDILEPDHLIDPLGGRMDLIEKKLRYCHPDSIKADPIRILRGIRLSLNLGLNVEERTALSLCENISTLPLVSMERKRDELFKILDLGHSKRAVEMLDEMGILQVLLPDTLSLKGAQQSPPHVFDVWQHTLITLFYLDDLFDSILSCKAELVWNKDAGPLPIHPLLAFQADLSAHFQKEISPGRTRRALLLFSALLHDFGKPGRMTRAESGRIRFLGHEQLGSEMAEQLALQWVLSNEEVNYIKQVVGSHMRIHALTSLGQVPERRILHRFFRDNQENGVDICILTLADSLATYGGQVPAALWTLQLDICSKLLETWFEKKEEVVYPPKLLSGNEIMKILHLEPGPVVGKAVLALQEAQGAGEVLTVEDALNYIKGWYEKQVEGGFYDNVSSN